MIIGCGIDLCKISRIQKAYENNIKFAKRILTNNEYIKFSENYNISFLAKNWAAKEAFAKACTLGLSKIGLQNLEINHMPNGQPYFKLNDELKHILKTQWQKNIDIDKIKIDLSISDDDEYTIAFVIISCNNISL